MKKILYVYKTRYRGDDFKIIKWCICDTLNRVMGINGITIANYFILDNIPDCLIVNLVSHSRPISLKYICSIDVENEDLDPYNSPGMGIISTQFGKFNEVAKYHKDIAKKFYEGILPKQSPDYDL